MRYRRTISVKFRKRLLFVIMVLGASTFAAGVPGCIDSTGPHCQKKGERCIWNSDCCRGSCVSDFTSGEPFDSRCSL
jgi:hypothetical protein